MFMTLFHEHWFEGRYGESWLPMLPVSGLGEGGGGVEKPGE